ncbi:MAG TPA: FAD-dependent oxidoreductase, partial [Zeimonas sp.]
MQQPTRRRSAFRAPSAKDVPHAAPEAPFRSFWMGGYEGADHRNGSGTALDMAASNAHIDRLDEDYAAAARHGIRTVRESLGWRLCEPRHGHFDWRRLHAIRRAARRNGVQVLWTLMHYGTPDDVRLLDDAMIERFARFARSAAIELVRHGETGAFVTPINEIGFLAWAVCESKLLHPYCRTTSAVESSRESGYRVKRRLVRAALRAIDEIRAIDPGVRFLHVEPLVHVAAPVVDDPNERTQLAALADEIGSYQWQAWDMLCGREAPELGGSPDAIDWVGANHYHTSQWEIVSEKRLSWSERDPRRVPLSALLGEAWRRYRRPLIVAETGHIGVGRADWLDDVGTEVVRARENGVPVHGLCLYPLVNRPDWDDADHWHDSGLWDVVRDRRRFGERPDGFRLLNHEYASRLRHWQAPQHVQQPTESNMPHLIVFSHLRWDFVYQRPQHLMSRLAQRYRVLFVEEPVHRSDGPRLQATSGGPGIQVLRPCTPVPAAGFHDDQLPVLKSLIAGYLSERGIDDYVAWCYTPMALPLLGSMRPRALVYDCMDELAAFAGAPRQLGQREAALLKAADLVFTGGPSLYEAKRALGRSVHCLPSAVEALHFAPPPEAFDSEEARDAAELQRDIPHPQLGFFGVIDERLDRDLLAQLADAHPEWHVVMVGPVAKIDPASLPQRPNVHWLGMQSYARLPFLLAEWDLCLLPFASNAATRFISPTKTLEYMAAGKPIVSTAVADVAALHGDVVSVAGDAAAFVRACEDGIAETPAMRVERQQRMARRVAEYSWDRSVDRIDELLREHLAHGTTPVAMRELAGLVDDTGSDAEPLGGATRAPSRRAQRDVRHLVIGAGPTGLSAAYHLGAAGESDVLLVERGKRVGGWCRSVEEGGFVFDYAGHILFSNDAYVLELYELLLGENLHWQNREAWIYSKGVHTRYPFQGSLHGLPPQVLEECLVGAIEARFGAIDGNGPAQPAQPPANFLEFIHRVWGAGIAKHFAVPYNEKLWAVPLDEIETSWLGGRV